MKSIKPGRGPSMMGGIGAIFAAVFGVIWMIAALSMGAPPLFAAFGVIFIAMAIVNAVYHIKNATGKKRYSAFDITEDGEENDPLNERFGDSQKKTESGEKAQFCPYCGTKAEATFLYCTKCGKELPNG